MLAITRTEVIALRLLARENDFSAVICTTSPGAGWQPVWFGERPSVWFTDEPAKDLRAFVAALAGTAPVVWRWRRSLGLDCLSVPDGMLIGRTLGSTFPLAPFVGEPNLPPLKSSEITGNPRWLVGMALVATRRRAALEQLLERL